MLQEVKQAIRDMATAFDTLESVVKGFSNEDKRRFLNTETFGPISAFLERDAGYEPAGRNPQAHTVSDLLKILEKDENEDDS